MFWNCTRGDAPSRRGKFSTNLSLSGRIRQVQNTTCCRDSGTMNLNSIRISTVRGHAPYKYPPRTDSPFLHRKHVFIVDLNSNSNSSHWFSIYTLVFSAASTCSVCVSQLTSLCVHTYKNIYKCIQDSICAYRFLI